MTCLLLAFKAGDDGQRGVGYASVRFTTRRPYTGRLAIQKNTEPTAARAAMSVKPAR